LVGLGQVLDVNHELVSVRFRTPDRTMPASPDFRIRPIVRLLNVRAL